MTYFVKFLIQGLSKYYKENYHDSKRIFQKKIQKYSRNISSKAVTKVIKK